MSENLWRTVTSGVFPLAARFAICCIFVQGAMGKIFGWSGQSAYMEQHGVGPTTPLLATALAVEVIGVICLLIGYQARWAALAMAAYLVAVTVLLHNFWNRSGMAQMLAQTEFMKNVAIIGGLLMIVSFGTGRFSLDHVGGGTRGRL